MTYCVGMSMNSGIVLVSDSRTNAGVDQVSTYSKMHLFNTATDRVVVLMGAGNLATTQGVVERIRHDLESGAARSLNTLTRFGELADYIGQISVSEQQSVGGGGDFEASFIVAGQLPGEPHRVMLVYPQGNHITTSEGTPFLQIGESKYGKPILDRIIGVETPLETAVLCGLVSMDSTMRSNLTVGPPIEVLIYQANTYSLPPKLKFSEHSEYLRQLRHAWDAKLKDAFHQLPPLAWASNWDSPGELVPGPRPAVQLQASMVQPAGAQHDAPAMQHAPQPPVAPVPTPMAAVQTPMQTPVAAPQPPALDPNAGGSGGMLPPVSPDGGGNGTGGAI